MRVVRSDRARAAARGRRVLMACAGALLVGCHHNTVFTPGTPVVTMGKSISSNDFAGYLVNVDGISLTDTSGNVVTLLGVAERMDLVSLDHLSEVVEVPAIPAATYVSATFTLDYSYATVFPIVNGVPASASIVDTGGTPPTTYSIVVTFDPDNRLVITNQQSTRLEIDIDLAASNSIDTATSPATVTVQPFVTMTPLPVDSTVMRARGLFVTTQSVPSGFYMNARPFYDEVSALGALVVNTNGQTYFNVNGVAYTGATGLTAVGALPIDTVVVAEGTLDSLASITPTFNATAVYAGTSTENALAEFVSGVVSSRSGSTINVRGATYFPPTVLASPPLVDGVAVGVNFYEEVPVTLASSTVVSEDGVNATGLNFDSVSVGEQVTISGQANVDSLTGQPSSLDASSGQVRLQSTPIWGTLDSASAGTASLDLLAFDSAPASTFDFAGTGTPAATPSSYQVATGSLNESAVPAGTLLQLNGVVTPFGSAPPDFVATSITPGSATVQQVVIEWANDAAAGTPFTSYDSSGLVVNLANTALTDVHQVRIGPTTLDITSLPASPPFKITTVGADQSHLVLAVGSSTLTAGISVFNNAARFVSGLSSALNGQRVFRLVAYGQYDSSNNTFVASRIYVALQEST